MLLEAIAVMLVAAPLQQGPLALATLAHHVTLAALLNSTQHCYPAALHTTVTTAHPQ
jgi:hypothetical protein